MTTTCNFSGAKIEGVFTTDGGIEALLAEVKKLAEAGLKKYPDGLVFEFTAKFRNVIQRPDNTVDDLHVTDNNDFLKKIAASFGTEYPKFERRVLVMLMALTKQPGVFLTEEDLEEQTGYAKSGFANTMRRINMRLRRKDFKAEKRNATETQPKAWRIVELPSKK
jgi:hypothetical protein